MRRTSFRVDAFSLLEALVAIGIVVLLAALLFPVFRSVYQGTAVSSSQSRLRQLHVAVQLYRDEFDGIDTYDSARTMALPTYSYVYGSLLGLGVNFWRSPCGYKSSIEPNELKLGYQYWIDHGPHGDSDLRKFKQNMILFSDPQCNPEGTKFWAPYTTKTALGIFVNGRAVNIRRRGVPSPEWWAEPVE